MVPQQTVHTTFLQWNQMSCIYVYKSVQVEFVETKPFNFSLLRPEETRGIKMEYPMVPQQTVHTL